MPPPLSPRTKHVLEKFFSIKDIAEASPWLEEECGNSLPPCGQQDEYGMEPIRFAAIKMSQGNVHKLLKAIDAARMDWRDLLMTADFGFDVDAHEIWVDHILNK